MLLQCLMLCSSKATGIKLRALLAEGEAVMEKLKALRPATFQ